MTERELADKDLRCASCGDCFVFSAGEQELYRVRGIASVPERCPNCMRGPILAAARRAGKNSTQA